MISVTGEIAWSCYAAAMVQQKHPHQKVHAFLRHHPLGVLSTASSDGEPWGAAVYFAVDEEFNFYFITRMKTLKYHHIETNPQASLTVTDPATQTTLQAYGSVRKVPPHDYMDVLFHKLEHVRPKGDLEWTPPLSKIHQGDYMPLKLTPSKLRFAEYGTYHLKPDVSYVEDIIG